VYLVSFYSRVESTCGDVSRLQGVFGEGSDNDALSALPQVSVRHCQSQLVLVQAVAVSHRSVLRLLRLSHPRVHRRALYRCLHADAV